MPREKPVPIPKRKQVMPTKSAIADNAPDLSHIAEGLRPLAAPVGELVFDPANARTHDEKSISTIAASLRVYGQCKPVVVRRDNGVVIAGNGTLQAALSLGWTHLAAVMVEMDGATAAGYSISDNRTTELSGWDKDALDKLLHECSTGNDELLDVMLAELADEAGIASQEGQMQPEAAAEPPSENRYQEQYGIIVICSNAAHQEEVYNALLAAGYECKVVTT